MSSQALAPRSAVLEAITKARPQFEGRLPEGMTVERFMFGISTSVQKNANLALCEPKSVLLAAYEAAECGCDLSPSRQLGWLIPYGRVAQFQPGYRFFIQEAHGSGNVKTFYAEVVYANDKFERQFAPKRNLFHAPADGDRGEPIGSYAIIEYVSGALDWEYLTKDQIMRHRAKSKQPDSMKWKEFWEEGWRITAIRVLFKRVPLTTPKLERLAEAIEKDEQRDLGIELAPGTIELEPDSPITSAAAQPCDEDAHLAGIAQEGKVAAPVAQDAPNGHITKNQAMDIYTLMTDLKMESTDLPGLLSSIGHKGKLETLPKSKLAELHKKIAAAKK